ncbi:MAG: efflux RND transporter permease subunit [Woeseiaceae bacterium]
MLRTIVAKALEFPILVLLLSVFLVVYGTFRLTQTEFEVFPEFVPAQASVQVEAPGMSAGQVEMLVTKPLEDAINGATGVAAVRSRSAQGLAVVDVTFREGEDPYRARQVVAERLAEAANRLPAGVGAPTLSPLTSSTMDLLKVGLVSDSLSPMQLRDIAQWIVRPRFLSTPGVARVNVYGGDLRRIEVRVRGNELLARGLALSDVVAAIRSATEVRGGGYIDTDAQRVVVEPHAAALSAQELAAAVVAPRPGDRILLGDIADVVDAPTPKFGDATIMGKPGVLLTLSSQYGANTLTVTHAVETALAELRPSLEAQGITVYPALHRPANFIETALAGIRLDLLLGAALITAVLFAFTRNMRVAIVAFVSIPLSLLAAMVVFEAFGVTINTMILGGLAVALGVVIDDAVIGAENTLRRLREHTVGDTRHVILEALVEVRAPVVYATLVLALTMAPVLLLSGLQGAFFAPLAASFVLATFASLLVAITVTPALAYLLLRHVRPPDEPHLLLAMKAWHTRVLRPFCKRPGIALVTIAALGVASVVGFLSFGSELLPAFRERHYVLSVAGPSGASLQWMKTIGSHVSKDLLAIPGVATVEHQIGRAESAEDTFPPNVSEMHVELGPVSGSEEDEILQRIRGVLASYPGLQTEALTFLGDRIGESLSGETAALVVSAYGPDLDSLDRVAAAIAATLRKVPGAVDVQVKTPPGAPGLAIDLDAAALAQRGVSPTDAYDAIEATYQGLPVSQVADGQRITEVSLVLPSALTTDPEAAGSILVRSTGGGLAPLSSVASISLTTSRATISHDGGRRRQVVTANTERADVGGFTADVKTAIAAGVKLPADVYLEYSGVAEGQAAARRELAINVTIAAAGIIALLVMAFGGLRPAILILSSAPSAMAGGIAAVALTGSVVSLGALVGFVTLFGITARNAILLVAHTDFLVEREGAAWGLETVLRATTERVTPILMTALVTALGMLPVALGTGEAGREVQGPMAEVILGGLATSTVLSLFLLPPLVLAFRHSGAAQAEPLNSDIREDD